jgi:hypothetical protein
MSGTEGKPFAIPRQLVWQAWKSVKANGGAAGADGVTVEAFGRDLKNNLYKVWLCRVEGYAEWAVLGDCLACSRPGQP